jgi:hypothetical protein
VVDFPQERFRSPRDALKPGKSEGKVAQLPRLRCFLSCPLPEQRNLGGLRYIIGGVVQIAVSDAMKQ